MITIRRFEDLEVWKKAREITHLVYSVTRAKEFSQDWELRGQMRESSVSMMANIAEGFSRNSDKEFVRFLFIAKGSAAELQSHCYVALDENYIPQKTFNLLYEKIDHACRMASNLIKHLSQ
jgi:four helix bundle protein